VKFQKTLSRKMLSRAGGGKVSTSKGKTGRKIFAPRVLLAA